MFDHISNDADCTKRDTNMTNVASYVASLNAAFDARVSYETEKKADNASMTKTLSNLRKSIAHEKVAAIMLACNVSADFINRAERNNARFNVYSAEKVANIARVLSVSTETLNHYTLAILKSCIALSDAKMSLTHDDAASACSSDLKSKDTKKRKLITHYQRVVAANTASTQSSSSINALQMFDIVKQVRDDANNVAYVFNDAHVHAKELRERFAA
jgi:hypothetical protein